jgi:hypothetical protein
MNARLFILLAISTNLGPSIVNVTGSLSINYQSVWIRIMFVPYILLICLKIPWCVNQLLAHVGAQWTFYGDERMASCILMSII